MSSVKDKKVKIEVKEEVEDVEVIDESIDKLEELQDQLQKLNEEACEEVLQVQHKYSEMRRPMYAKRNEVIKAIPDFWSTAFMSHPFLYDLLRPEDHKVFKYFCSLEVEEFKDGKSGYSITFNFNVNPYFENTKLSKAFITPEDSSSKVTGTTIKWKKGMDITNEVQQEEKGKKRAYLDGRSSFFCWFTVSEKKDIEELLDDEVAEVITEEFWPNPLQYCNYGDDEEDKDEFEVAEVITEELWPNPLQYCNYSDEGDSSDGDEEEEDDDDNDEDTL